MWEEKYFRTRNAMLNFVIKNHGKIQWHEIFMNNKYGIEYRKLRRVY